MPVLEWRRLDGPGLETCRRDGLRLSGSAVFVDEVPCLLTYAIEVDRRGRTRSAVVDGWIGQERIRVELRADARRRWTMNGRRVPAVDGADDVDFGFSPATNALPIRRLRLAVGREAPATAAWLRLPDLSLERLDQVYRRTGMRSYAYRSAGGFRARLAVDAAGFVTRYPGRWVRSRRPHHFDSTV